MPVPENELLQNWNAVTRMTACRNMKGSSNAAQDPHETSSSKKGIRPIPSAEVRRPTAPLSRSRLLANSLTIDEIFFRAAKRSRLHYEFPSLARPLPSFPPPMGEAADIGGGKGLAIPPIYRKDMSQGVRKCFPGKYHPILAISQYMEFIIPPIARFYTISKNMQVDTWKKSEKTLEIFHNINCRQPRKTRFQAKVTIPVNML